MTRTIHADLLAEQKKTALVPSLSFSLQDNELPHALEMIAHPMTGYSGAPTASCVGDGVIVRAHRTVADGISVQRITDPETAAQWESWTQLAAGCNYPALFYDGTYVVCVYQDPGTKAVKWKRSSDGGQNWSAEQTIWTPAYLLNGFQIGVSDTGGTRAGIFYKDGTNVCFRLYDGSTDTFGGEISHDYTYTIAGIGACYDGSDVYRLALILEDHEGWATSDIVVATYTYGGAWGSLTTYVGVQGGTGASPAYTYAHVNLAKIGTNYWLSFELVTDTDEGAIFAEGDQVLCFSDDGVYFTGGVKLGQPDVADRVQPLYWSASGNTYLASDSAVMKSDPPSTVGGDQGDVISYEITDAGPEARISITLDNRDGAFDGIETGRLGTDLVLERGAVCSGTARRVAREKFVIDSVRWSKDLKRVTVTGYNYYRLLRLWQSELVFYYASISLQNLVTTIAALAGIHAATFDGAGIWSETVAEFAMQPGQSALRALEGLMAQWQFVARIDEDNQLECFVLSSAPAADYVFGQGAGEHPTFWVEDTAERSLPEVTHAVVVGDGAAAEDLAAEIQAESGRQFTGRVTQRYISTAAQATAAAGAVIDKVEASVSRAQLACMPAFHLEPFDVVSSDSWAADQVRYVARIEEHYDTEATSRARTWAMTLTLAEMVQASRGGRSVGLVDLEGIARPVVRRGEVVSFDAATWKALIRLEGCVSSVEVRTGEWVQSASMAAGDVVAVLLFDESNPEDGLVLGPFGGTGDVIPDDSVTGAKISPDAVFGASGAKLGNFVPYSNDENVLYVNLVSDSRFAAQINGAPAGAVVGYKNVVGNENSIVPQSGAEIGKLVLHNTARSEDALIESVNTGANTITVTNADDVAAWANDDAVQVNSLICTDPGRQYFFDLDLSGFLPATAIAVSLIMANLTDSAAGRVVLFHPLESFGIGKAFPVREQVANQPFQSVEVKVAVVSQRVCLYWDASGAGTMSIQIKTNGWFEEATV